VRVALRPDEAAAVLGLSRSQFYAEVAPKLRWILVGRRTKIVAMSELERWTQQEQRRLSAEPEAGRP
jgi:predicted DNA-binding transcriptional regulator AlpA